MNVEPQNAGQPAPAGPVPVPPQLQSSLLHRFRSALLTSLSLVFTAVVIGNAYYQRQQFYPSVVYITKSNPSMAVIYVQAFVFVILFGKLMRKVFFGRLRAAEFEHLMERSWYAVTETCLAFTVFKDDFSPKFVALFTLLLFLKSFHWLAEDRVDFMERSPTISALFHIRVVSLNSLLTFIDIHFILYAYTSTLSKGPSVQLVFGFEYAVLMTIVGNTLVKYILHSVDLYSENPWENKAVFMLYTELVIGAIKVVLYILFIGIMIRIYTLPLFAVRPMYLTMRAFKKALNDVILSRRAIHNMNTCYPDATAEELAATDNVCIICREEMTASPATKKLPCNHIFHKNCLRSWFQRQQTCPTCRLDVLRSPQAQRQGAQEQQQQRLPRQQQQQQRQQPAGNLPVPNLQQIDPQNLFAHLVAAGRINIPPMPQVPTTSAGPGQASGTTTTTTSTGTSSTSSLPPILPPPFPFFTPFTIPPPMPPHNFSGLTDAELQEMEGNERENVEARIKCLRNIQVLLDAAMLQMQQYSAVAGARNRSSVTSPSSVATSVNATATVTTATPSTATVTSTVTAPSSSMTNVTVDPPRPETGATPKIKSVKESENESEEVKKEEEVKKGADTDSTEDSEKDELRRRRLARFENN